MRPFSIYRYMKFIIEKRHLKLIKESIENKYTKFSNLTDSDLRDIARWGLESEYEYSGCWDDNETIDEAIDCAVDDFQTFLNKPYPEMLGNFPAEPEIYRLVRLKSKEDLNKRNLGYDWFSNPSQFTKPEFYDMLDHLKSFTNELGELYLLKAKTKESNVDIPRTLWQRSTQFNENEIMIKDDMAIDLISLKKIKSKTLDTLNESNIKEDETIKKLMLNSPDLDGFFKALEMKYGKKIPLYHATTPENAKQILKNGFKLQDYGANKKNWSWEPNLYFQIGKSDYVAKNRPVLLRIDVPLEFIEKYAYADMDSAWVDDEVLTEYGVNPEELSSDMEDFVRYFIWNGMQLDGMEIIIEDRDYSGEDIFKQFKPKIVKV